MTDSIRKQIIDLRQKRLNVKYGTEVFKLLTKQINSLHKERCLILAQTSVHYKNEWLNYMKEWEKV